MTITAAMVKELREMSGAGMMDCKNALMEADGDMDKAGEVLREKGLAKAVKKSGRIAAEGLVSLKVSDAGDKAVAVEVNSETDFVAKNEKFRTYVSMVADQALDTPAMDVEAFLEEPWQAAPEKTVTAELAVQIALIGENIKNRRVDRLEEPEGFIAPYTHMGGKIGVLVDVKTDVINDEIKEMAKNLAMQVAALRPQYTDRSEISEEFIAHEEEILRAQIMNDPKESQKPEKVIEGIIKGRVNKELKEICLMDQIYVKAEDGKQTVSQYVDQVAKDTGADIMVKGFIRFETGEGIEKKQEDFAAEVAAQMAGN
ncbi:MAG: translation elongation factor Ts [Lachnospiraceae bacterium]|nr:translation elongation factor Ts [Lachnospiraceae bacterium]